MQRRERKKADAGEKKQIREKQKVKSKQQANKSKAGRAWAHKKENLPPNGLQAVLVPMTGLEPVREVSPIGF